MSDNKRLQELRDEVALLKKLNRQGDRLLGISSSNPKGYAFDDLYRIVTFEYGKWDEGESVDWGAVSSACSIMISAIRRGQKED